jgi:hypothetical protein
MPCTSKTATLAADLAAAEVQRKEDGWVDVLPGELRGVEQRHGKVVSFAWMYPILYGAPSLLDPICLCFAISSTKDWMLQVLLLYSS